MSHGDTASLLALPVELIYRILDNLRPSDIILSVRNVCQRLDAVTDTYHPYQVKLKSNSSAERERKRDDDGVHY